VAVTAALLQREIAEAYGLQVDVSEPKSNAEKLDQTAVAVARWRARIQVPQTNPSLPQGQVINIEVASIPAHQQTLMPISANYAHLPAPLRQMMVLVESPSEILADKLVALGARSYMKSRDIWDIKFLTDKGIRADDDVTKLVIAKLADYQIDPIQFRQQMQARLRELIQPRAEAAFVAEMSRFVDAGVATQIKIPGISRQYLERSIALGQALLSNTP